MTSTFTRKKIEGYSYGLNDVIGKGYSSHVYKGRNDDNNHPAAIKVIDLRMLKNQINRVLLESEIQVLKELQSLSHILTLNEVYTTKNNTYIITELCDSDLNKTIKKKLTEPEAISFMQQILVGYLNFARKDIIHRDLKPANILITENRELKIADFGFAIKTADALKSNKYNVGSPLYMAPESLKRNEYTPKTDIWALGIIFFEMIMGETPWKAKNEKELIRKIESEKIDDLLHKLKMSPVSKEFLRKTLRTDKASRMNLEEVAAFDFDSSSNVLGEKKLNVELRAINISQNMSMFTPKTEKTPENRMFADRSNNENRRCSKEQSVSKFNSFRNESVNPVNHSIQLKSNNSQKYNPFNTDFRKEAAQGKENPETPSQPTLRQNQSELRHEKKAISKILVSQIHFCRFLFKLISRISDSCKRGLLQEGSSEVEGVMRGYTAIIKHKIDNLAKFSSVNFIGANSYEEYKEGSDYLKLMKIAREYRQRYNQELKQYWGGVEARQTTSFSTGATVELIEQLYRALQVKEGQEGFVESCSKEIVILDYLITSKQLIELFKNGENYDRFSRKSRIEEIVEGRTADISRELYFKIMNRAKEVTAVTLPSYTPSNYSYQMDDNRLAI